MDNPKKVFYKDELKDEFSDVEITPIKIDKDFVYMRNNIFYKLSCFLWYRIFATPIAIIYMKLKFRHKYVGKKKIKKGEGFFLFSNHTNNLTDVIVPSLIKLRLRSYIIAHANNVSIKYIKNVATKLGAIPLPDDIDATRNFKKCLDKRFAQKACITIYPEAHIWPYCTWIRNFPSTSFRYPVLMDATCYTATNTYQKRKFSKNPRMVTYIDGPFYPDKDIPRKDAQQKLRDEIYETMKERAKLNTVTLVEYIKEEEND